MHHYGTHFNVKYCSFEVNYFLLIQVLKAADTRGELLHKHLRNGCAIGLCLMFVRVRLSQAQLVLCNVCEVVFIKIL